MIIKKVHGSITSVIPWSKNTSVIEVVGVDGGHLGIAPNAVTLTRGSNQDYYFLTMSSDATGIMQFVFTNALDAVAAAWIAQNVKGFGLGKSAFVTGQYGVAAAYTAAAANDTKFFSGSGIAAAGMKELASTLTRSPWFDYLGAGGVHHPVLSVLVSLGFSAADVTKSMKKLGSDATLAQIMADLKA
jgi:hypothetical protein